MQTTIRECTAFSEAAGFAFNADERLLENVAICGRQSKNGYEYSEAALRGAAEMYAGRPVFLNHKAGGNPKDRDIRDVAGRIEGPAVFDGERLRGRIRLLETDAGRTLASLASAGMAGVGLSHVVMADMDRRAKRIDAIREVVSVDAVVFPATTVGFSEQDRGEQDMELGAVTYSELKAARPELLEEAVRESGLATKLAEKDSELAAMRAKLDAFETRDRLAQRRIQIGEQAKAAGLDASDAVVFPESLVASLMDVADDADRARRIADHAALVKTLKEQAAAVLPSSPSRIATPPEEWSPARFFESQFAR